MKVIKRIIKRVSIMMLAMAFLVRPVYASTITTEGTYSVKVNATIASSFTVALPVDFSLELVEGYSYVGTYQVGAKGNISSNQVLNVAATPTFEMIDEAGKATATATVEQSGSQWKYGSSDGGCLNLNSSDYTYASGKISVTFPQAGNYSGVLGFSVFLQTSNS